MGATNFGIYVLCVLIGVGVGFFWRQRILNAACLARLEAQKLLADAKTEYGKMKQGLLHDLDRILG
jgi:hypothetical protein